MKISQLFKNPVAAVAIVGSIAAFAAADDMPSQSATGAAVTTDSGASATTASATEAPAPAGQVKGTIESVDSTRRKVTIRDSQGNLSSYQLQAGADINFQGHKAALTTLVRGDSVTLTPAKNDPTSATAISVGS